MASQTLLYHGNRRGLIREAIRILGELFSESVRHANRPIVNAAKMATLVLPLQAYLQSLLLMTRPVGPLPIVTVSDPGPQTNAPGDLVALQMLASDTAALPLTWSVAGLPAGLAINALTGLISGTVGAGAAAGSPYDVTATAADGTNTGSASFVWVI